MVSGRLKSVVKQTLIEMGKNAAEKLALKANVSTSTVRNINSGHIPESNTAYAVALACGCTKEDALKIAEECSSDGAKETA